MVTGQEGPGGPFVPSLDTHPFGTPLREFEAILQKYTPTKHAAQEGGREYMTIVFDFVDVVVIASVEPYPFPIATISLPYSTTDMTRWDALATSIKKVFGSTPALEELVGKKQIWKYLPCTLRKRAEDGTWSNADDEAWQLVSIEGAGEGVTSPAGTEPGFDIDDYVLGLLDGKTEPDFYQVLYQDPKVRAYPELITAATNRELLTTLEKAGRVNRDSEGIYHRVEVAAGTAPPQA